MAYDETFAEMLRDDLNALPAITERRMFGGLFFLQHGHMLVGVSGRGGGMARVGPAGMQAALQIEGVERVEMGGRRMNGFVWFSDEAMDDDDRRLQLIAMARDFVSGLPPKA